jgi:hypothetical protein
MASSGRGTVLAAACLAVAACSDHTQGERGQNQRAQGAASGDGGQPAGQPAAASPADAGRTAQEIEGTLTRAATDQVVIRSQAHGDLALRLDDGTRITVDGQPASPDRLHEGVEVRAAYETAKGGRPTATFIQAESAEAASSRTTSGAHGNAGASPSGSGLGPGPSPEGGGHDQSAGGKKKE